MQDSRNHSEPSLGLGRIRDSASRSSSLGSARRFQNAAWWLMRRPTYTVGEVGDIQPREIAVPALDRLPELENSASSETTDGDRALRFRPEVTSKDMNPVRAAVHVARVGGLCDFRHYVERAVVVSMTGMPRCDEDWVRQACLRRGRGDQPALLVKIIKIPGHGPHRCAGFIPN